MIVNWNTYLSKTVSPASLVVYRVCFGLFMCGLLLNLWQSGIIETDFIAPRFHFTYIGFDWVKPIGKYTYAIFAFCGLSALFVALGLKYRIAIISFCLSFTYIQLMDKTYYSNLNYLIGIMALLLVFLPAHAAFSLDSLRSRLAFRTIPKWTVDAVKLLICIVYIYSGLSKLNSEWLWHTQPLKLWLSVNPKIGGELGASPIIYYVLSLGSMFIELLLPWLLLKKRTRFLGVLIAVLYHSITYFLLPTGAFPLFMIITAPIFLSIAWHQKALLILRAVLSPLQFLLKFPTALKMTKDYHFIPVIPLVTVGVFFGVMILFPLRAMFYSGDVLWTDEGYRFSWRELNRDKKGETRFKIVDGNTGESFWVENTEFLTPLQSETMQCNSDFIQEFAHFLGSYYQEHGFKKVKVFVQSNVSLNDRPESQFINANTDLFQEKRTLKHKTWIVSLKEEIKGF